jgi:hypothetical protein
MLVLSVWKPTVLSTINVIVSGKQSFDTKIIVGVKRIVEIIICHFKIPSIIPEAEDSKEIYLLEIYLLEIFFIFFIYFILFYFRFYFLFFLFIFLLFT